MNDRGGQKFDPAKLARLDRPERLAELRPRELLVAAGVERGRTVADVGCGTGVFTLPAAELVGQAGVVYALDISEEMLDHLRRRDPPGHVRVLRSEESALPLADDLVDVVVLGSVLHEATDRPAFLAEIERVLKPGGRLACLEWKRIRTDSGPPMEARLSEEEAAGLLESAGLDVVSTLDWSPSRYVLVAAKDHLPSGGSR